MIVRGDGSPPRVRGRAQNDTAVTSFAGITPARAGKSRCRLAKAQGYGDHPRACGEEIMCQPFHANSSGSPPRVRGRGKRGQISRANEGITPARAGKSMVRFLDCEGILDHPRACGEEAKRR